MTLPISTELRPLRSALDILVVDDDEDNLRLLARPLRRSGHRVALARSSAEARRYTQAHPPSVVLSDLAMPLESGIELAAWAHENFPAVPVILMSADPDLSSAMTALSVGVVAFLRKPIDLRELGFAVRRAADEREMRLAARAYAHETETEARDWRHRHSLFEGALQHLGLLYQPLRRVRTGRTDAYEAILSVEGLGSEGARTLRALAAELDRQPDLELRVRELMAGHLAHRSDWHTLFIDVQTSQVLGGFLGSQMDPLLPHAERVVLDLGSDLHLPDTAQAREYIAKLRSAGFRLAVDDIGGAAPFPAGVFSLQPDFVRIVPSHLIGRAEFPSRRRYLRFLVDMAREGASEVIASGVDDAMDLDLSMDLGVDLTQGSAVGPPAELDSLPACAPLLVPSLLSRSAGKEQR